MVRNLELNARTMVCQGQSRETHRAILSPSVELLLDLDSGPATITARLNQDEIAALTALFDQIEARVMESFRAAG